MVNARSKGQRGERDFLDLLQGVIDEVFGPNVHSVKRNLQQYCEGGKDIISTFENKFSIEVKRCEVLNLSIWWQQTLIQTRPGQIPILAFKQNRKKWQIMMPGTIGQKGDITLACVVIVELYYFLEWYKKAIMEIKENGII